MDFLAQESSDVNNNNSDNDLLKYYLKGNENVKLVNKNANFLLTENVFLFTFDEDGTLIKSEIK